MRFNWIVCLLIFLGGCSAAASKQPLDASPLPPAGSRKTVLISDLHLGIGHVAQDASGAWTVGPWHPMEDFRWHAEFDAFLTRLESDAADTATPVDLVILGDFLELWQTPWSERDCIYDTNGKPIDPKDTERTDVEMNWSCTEGDALKRARRVLDAHEPTLRRLRAFAEWGDNRVTIVPGNHDAALIYPEVSRATLSAIKASPDRLRIAGEGYWRSRDGQIFAEHGHFLQDDVNKYDVLPASCLDRNEQLISCAQQGAFLRRPWGEQFVQRYYNQFEERFPIIDNLTNELDGVKIALVEAGPADSLRAVRDGLKFLLLQQSRTQFASMLGGDSDRTLGAGGVPGWDIELIRTQIGDRFLVESLDSDDPLRPAAESALARSQLNMSLKDLTDENIRSICNGRAARIELASQNRRDPHVTMCPGTQKLGAIKTALTRTEAQRLVQRFDEVRESLPEASRPTKEFAVYAYAHTHSEHAACKPKEALSDSAATGTGWNPVAVNTGAWQRLVSPTAFQAIQPAPPTRTPLSSFSPEDLPACFSSIVIPAYTGGKPEPTLSFWSQDSSGQWDLRRFCSKDSGRGITTPCAN
jgi:UDP-2,3-diacylglucosamine pyrophosphatase LpxH